MSEISEVLPLEIYGSKSSRTHFSLEKKYGKNSKIDFYRVKSVVPSKFSQFLGVLGVAFLKAAIIILNTYNINRRKSAYLANLSQRT